MELGVQSHMQEMVVGDVLELVGSDHHVLLEVVDMEVPKVTAETKIADVDIIDVTVMDVILDGQLATARKLVINANNGILNS